MTEFAVAHSRHFPRTDLAADTALVVPDGLQATAPVVQLQGAIAAVAGRAPDIVPQRDFADALFGSVQVIACGNAVNNAALRRLYAARCCFVDTFFPGGDGYFVKSVSDPFGYGKNCIVLGASSREGLLAALAVFEDLVRTSAGQLHRVHAARFEHPLPPFPPEAQLERMIQDDLDTWEGIWVSTPFRGGQVESYAWYYYLTDHPVWGRAVPAIFAGSLEPWLAQRRDHPQIYHCFFHFHSLIHLWDLIEDSPLYTEADRCGVVAMMGEMLRHLAGLFYMEEKVNPPGQIRQNHTTYIAMDLAAGHHYLSKRYGIREFESTEDVVERIFAGQSDCYKANDDGGVGYAWLVPQETLSYALLKKNDYRYIEDGHIADLCTLAVVTTDNMRSESNHGDTAGYTPFSPSQGWEGRLWAPMVSTWYAPNPEHLWILNWLGAGKRPTLTHVLRGLYAGVEWGENGLALAAAEKPVGLLGIYAMKLPAKALRWVCAYAPADNQPDPQKDYFDKLSLRRDFDPASEYLLLEGSGTFCHGHEDSNTIVRLTWNDRAWLGDGDYIRAAPKFHNSIAVIRDGVGVLQPPGDGLLMPLLASLNYSSESSALGLVQTEVSGYNGVDWRRHIFWGKGRYFAVIDQLQCTEAGDYRCYCLWRLVGEAELKGAKVCLQQEGEHFYIHNADGSAQEIVADLHEKSRWHNYPHAGDVLHILHQQAARTMQPGEHLVYVNLLTPHADIRVQRLNERTVEIRDGAETTILGVGHTRLGEVMIEAEMFALSLKGDSLTLHGIERLGLAEGEHWTWQVFDGSCETLTVGQSETAQRIGRAMEAVAPAAPPSAMEPSWSRPPGGWNTQWSRDLGPTEIHAVAVHGEILLAGTAAGEVVQLRLPDGAALWSHQLGPDRAASALLLADIDADGAVEALVGTDDGQLAALESQRGEQRWCSAVKNSGWGSRVSGLAVADLEGRGRPSVLASTVGWCINAFAADGALEWAEWVRYHAITALAAEDVDGDGQAEVMVGTEYSTPLNVHNGDGSFRWTTFEEVGSEGNATTPRRGIGLTHMQLVDVDRDGVREIVYGTQDGWIYAVKPQDGAEVWHVNIVGAVAGLIAFPFGLVAASEFGTLYAFSHRGELLWHVQIGEWIRAIAPVGEHIVAAVEKGALLACDADGRGVGATAMEAEIRGLWPCRGGVVCSLAGGRLSCVELRVA